MTEFDVFLSHNSRDKPAVRKLAELLKGRGVSVWLDEEQLVPGRPWQPLLEKGIEGSATGAVLVGRDGLGPWENVEMEALLNQAVDARKPVMPVLLPGAQGKPKLPLFLHRYMWVDLRSGFTGEGIDKLVWGIRGARPGVAEPDGEYGQEGNNPLAKIFDHTHQLGAIRALLSGSEADPVLALVDACAEDWPSYLADHLYLDPWPDVPGSPSEALSLGVLTGSDDQELWRALVGGVPGAAKAPDDAQTRSVVRGWLEGAGLRVLFLIVKLKHDGRRLPRIVRDAHATLAALGRLAPGARVLVLIACVPEADRVPFWWPWFARFGLSRLKRCHRLEAMRQLDKADIAGWHAGFPQAMRRYYDHDQLYAELLALFKPDHPGIRYEQARRRLVDEGALDRARRRP